MYVCMRACACICERVFVCVIMRACIFVCARISICIHSCMCVCRGWDVGRGDGEWIKVHITVYKYVLK